MLSFNNLRTRYWLYVFGFLGIIYSTLYIVRPICTFLKATTPFPLLINTLCIVLLILIAMGIRMTLSIRHRSSYILLSIVLFVYFFGIVTFQYPEEKIHFIEYGFMAYLAFKAIRVDIQKPIVYGYAFLLTSIFGWIDEGIQYCLPNRYYQLDDVVLNSISAALGLIIVFVFEQERNC